VTPKRKKVIGYSQRVVMGILKLNEGLKMIQTKIAALVVVIIGCQLVIPMLSS
jgi:hypothetical protein